MRRAFAIIAALGAAAAMMAARPGNEFTLLTQLNGQPTRWVMPDGGRSGAWNGSGSTACMPLTGATNSVNGAISPNVIVFVPTQAGLLCVRPSVFSPAWDGGCNHYPADENFGLPLQAGVPQYFTPDVAARSLCFVTDAGRVDLPAWTVQ